MSNYFDLQNSPVLTTPSALVAPKITSIGYPGDDTAADPAGGQTITLTGAGFEAGASVIINSNAVGVVSVVNSTTITFTTPALSAGSYPLYVVNTDGGTAIAVPGIQYSGVPAWTTAAGSLGSYTETTAISNTVVATGDAPITYSLFSGSLPTGATLNSANGLISGASPLAASPTTYTFTIRATDAQQQDTNRQFSLTINPDVVTWSTPANNTTYTSFVDAAISNVALSATAASGQTVSYTANALPTGLSISGSNITGTPTVVANSSTLLTATAATTNATATRTINWVINVASDAYFPYVTTLLSASTPTSTFVTDASTNNFALTVLGDARPSNFGPYTPGYYSNYFDGTGDYLSATTVESVGSGDFTIECWAYSSGSVANNGVWHFAATVLPGSQAGLAVAFYGVGGWQFYYNGNFTNGGSAVLADTWYHLAVVRSGTNLRLYVNGTSVISVTDSTNYTGQALAIGGYFNTSYLMTGYVSNFRIVKGTAVYTSNFTPPTAPLTAIANTSLLTCQSNRFIDTSANNLAITRNGDVRVDGFDPFLPDTNFAGRGSGYFDGTGDYLTHTAINLGSTFTIECWIYKTNVSSTYAIILGDGFTSWFAANENNLIFAWGGSPYAFVGTFSLNAWNHIAIVANSGTVSTFINGVKSVTTASGLTSWVQSMIGQFGGSTSYPYVGYISDLRVINGTALYTTNFTPPSAPLTTIANTQLLTLQNNQPNNNSMFLDGSTNNFNITRNGNTTQGTFSPYGGGWSNYFDGVNNFLSITKTGGLGSGNFTLEFWYYPTATTGIVFNSRTGGTANDGIDISTALRITTANQEIFPTRTITLNVWTHIAVVRTGSTITLYINGTSVGTASNGNDFAGGTAFSIGGSAAGNIGYMTGYISNIRHSNTAVYTSSFTPSTTPLLVTPNTTLLTCADNRFIDDSANNFAVAISGSPVTTSIQRFNPFNPVLTTPTSYSGYFDGTGDYLSLTGNSNFNFTGDFTIEAFVYQTSSKSVTVLGQWSISDPGTQSFIFRIENTGKLGMAYNASTNATASNGTISYNTWNHVAWVKSGSTMRYYINGVQDSVTNSVPSLTNAGSTAVNIGLYNTAVDTYFNGYISNLRVLKGTALYTATFTPPTTPLTAITNTVLLTCQSPTFVDNSTNNQTITVNGDTVPRQFNPFGWTTTTGVSAAYTPALYGGSAYFDGNGDHLSLTNTLALRPGSGDFTIETWIYRTGAIGGSAPNATLYGTQWSGGSPSGAWILYLNNSYNVAFAIWNANIVQSTSTINIGRWYHIAVTRSGTTNRLFINGVLEATATSSADANNSAYTVLIGRYNDPGVSDGYLAGYMSDLRFSKGVARYTSNFVPPVAPLTAQQNTALLNNMTGAGIYDSAMMTVYETAGNAGISTSIKKYGNTSMYFDGTGDGLFAPYNVNLTMPGNFTVEFWINFTSKTGYQTIYSFGYAVAGGFIIQTGNGDGKMVVYSGPSATTVATDTGPTVNTGQWYHVAVVRSGSTTTIYRDGVSVGSGADTTAYSPAAGTAAIIGGGSSSGFNNYYLNGYIDDFRITKGYARYTSNFTPPTTPYIRN